MNKRTRDNINKDTNKQNKRHILSPSHKKRTKIDDDNDDLTKFLMFLIPPSGGPPPKPPNKNKLIVPIHYNECKNPLCNHKNIEEDPELVVTSTITEIKNIIDLIELGKTYHCKKNTMFVGMNLRILFNLIVPLTELNNMVGMENVKEHMVDQILFFLQGHHLTMKCGKCIDCSFGTQCVNSQTEMLHTVITGPPGVGKTELGKILGKVYKEMGVLSTGNFRLVTRADLIAGYLGQTAIKTQQVIDECKGGVLFIDEAYSLGNSELRDMFSKECIDTLNQNLSERRDFLCIIAGYKDALETCFFNYNEGLRRRFTFRYDIQPYKYNELLQIFENKVIAMGWEMCKDDTVCNLFKKNIKNFPNYGGDMETLLLNCKIVHSRRCTFKDDEKRKCLSLSDIELGIDAFKKHRKGKDNDDDYTPSLYS
jgi:hypothetical protein